MWHEIRAETLKQVRRPASWLLLVVPNVLMMTFVYLVPYAGASGGSSGPSSDRTLATALPDQFVSNAIGGTPVFVGACAHIFGVRVVGSEYSWETWKTVLAQGPRRTQVYAAKVATITAGVVVLIGTMVALSAAASAFVAAQKGLPSDWPTLADAATGAGAGMLICLMWAMFGAMLAVALRSVALPVGLGLVWLLAVQNLLAGLAAPLLEWVAQMQKALPGPNAGSLVGALGASPDTPGVEQLVGGGQAALVVAAYVALFTVVGGWLLNRRDIV
jgi:ABC-2 type transport system permease protein